MMLLALFLFYIIAGASTLQIKELQVPESIEAGQVVRLECIFELEKEDLYSVKWYKDDIEFFRFVLTDRPTDYFFKTRGIEVDVSNSFNGTVTLKNTSRWTEGLYRCEVSADAPSFDTKSSEKFMVVEDVHDKSVSVPDFLNLDFLKDSLRKCGSLSLTLELISVKFLPNQKQLRSLCPKVMTFLECQTEDVERDEQTLEEMAVFSYKAEATEAKILLGKKSLVRDLCDEDSSFHKDYIKSFNCIREYIEQAAFYCYQLDFMYVLDRFYDDLDPLEHTSRSDVWDEMICLSDALETTCLIRKLGEKCGTGAEKTIMAALQRLKPLLKTGACSGVENKRELKSSLLEYLNYKDEKKTRAKKVLKLF